MLIHHPLFLGGAGCILVLFLLFVTTTSKAPSFKFGSVVKSNILRAAEVLKKPNANRVLQIARLSSAKTMVRNAQTLLPNPTDIARRFGHDPRELEARIDTQLDQYLSHMNLTSIF